MIKVVKIGGNVVDNPELLQRFVRDFAAIPGRKILVHGGGVMASQMQKSMGMTPVMIEGRRVTDEETLRIVTMVYAGWCSKNIVALLQSEGCNAIGLSGADGNVIKASRRPAVEVRISEEECRMVDYGYVGDVTPDSINAGFIDSLLEKGIVPVFNAINHDGNGNLLNTNADTIASSVAIAMARFRAEEDTDLIYCFEKDGVLYDKNDSDSVIPEIGRDRFDELKKEGRIADGMIPKLTNSFKAIDNGVRKVIIKHAGNLLNEIGTTLI
ncbi:MAG: acetylglutamate kinase [Bacteroidales bacterium]|nr:acetylglutamate kinase [Bacteroidales bacterium]